VLQDDGSGRDHRVRADPTELMDAHEAAQHREVAHDDMTRELRVVGKGRVVADDAVVRDVRVGEQQIAIADGRLAPVLPRTRVDRQDFADDLPVADPGRGGLAAILAILRNLAYRRELEDAVAAPDPRPAGDDDVARDHAALANRDLRSDHAIR